MNGPNISDVHANQGTNRNDTLKRTVYVSFLFSFAN